ncbi:70 kDa peptidyl-prolyl isomerase-like [Aristolochia californica]|uniref:70 kDa peptidyl-prolyl isomerase-like n=1 Tax=Aristolochia californica TaxID=171875 RepID=UPI0035E2675F
METGASSQEDKEVGSQGLKKRILKPVHYSGLMNGGQSLGSSRDEGAPFSFILGRGEVIKGLDEGIATMKKGERAIFTIPPSLAYGEVGSPPLITPNATLFFDVELLSWNTIRDLTGDRGVIKKIVREGEGWLAPKELDEVFVKYSVKLEDGTIVSKSEDGVEFYVSNGWLCPAIGIAVKTMRKGEIAELSVKYSYGLEQNGNGALKNDFQVPTCSELIVDIELVSWKSVIDVTGDRKVVKKVIKVGEGYDSPSEGSLVNVKYTGKLEDGTIFERKGSNEEPFEFTCFGEQILDGLDRAITTMRRGEVALVTVASEYAFGDKEYHSDLAVVPSNSKLIYEVELIKFTKDKEFWKMETWEKFEASRRKKDEGNNLFKAAEYVEYDHSFSAEEKIQANELKTSCNLNNATCKLKLGEYVGALGLCTKVLEVDPQNLKALYRRSQTYLRTSDLEKAEADLKKALSLDPNNRDVRFEYKKLKEKQREYQKDQAKIYGAMLSKLGQSET